MKVRLDQFVVDPTTNILVHPQYSGFEYSDGLEAENRIYQILLKAKDRRLFSTELQNAIADWPTEYHFSRQRHNLLRHLSFESSAQILELGAGCGAITCQLGETGAAVTAIEGSMSRAKCAALRCSNLPNVRVYCGNFQQIEFTHKFDFVFLIGVLEYCPMYFEDEEPFGKCLKLVKDILKPRGKLILAIENRLGLKYFMGYSEDHTGQPYLGIQDLYTRKTAKTLGREELHTTLIHSGFEHIEFQYPFPDYKIPNAVFTEQAFHVEGFASGEIIRQFRSRDYLARATPAFSENLVWPQIASNGLIPALSNSFLVIAGMEPVVGNRNTDSLLAVVYCTDRNKEYSTETRFLLDQCDRIKVVKRLLFDEQLVHSNVVELIVRESAYYQGTHLGADLMKRLLQNDSQGFLALCNLWYKYVKRNGLLDSSDSSGKSLIKPEFIDCIPANLILNKGGDGLEYIDREWHYRRSYSLEMLIVRGLYQFQTVNGLDDFLASNDSAFAKLARSWLETLRILLDEALISSFVEAEIIMCDSIYGKEVWSPIKDLRNRINESWARKQIRLVNHRLKQSAKRLARFAQIRRLME